MKGRQFIRRLRKAGAEIDAKRGNGGHCLVTYRGRQTTVPIHGDTDLGPDFLKRICKQLRLDPTKVL